MARKKSPFDIRMMYAPSRELIDYAARAGCNWAVCVSTGHKTPKRFLDDPPAFMPDYQKLARFRRPMRAQMADRIRQIRRTIRQARKAGLKVIFHSYEPSFPNGFQEAYPDLHCPPDSVWSMGRPSDDAEDIREVCVARQEVREALAAKVAELCGTFDIDGFSYTNNESGTRAQVWHRCEHCKDVPFAVMMKHLHDAIAEGIARSGKPIRLFNRCWGSHETEEKYWISLKMRADFGIGQLPDKAWLGEWVRLHQAANMHFSPGRDIPRYLELLKGTDTAFIYKATWADVNLHHPLNPWIGRYEGHDQVCEISWEHCSVGVGNFHIMGREMQRRARICREKGVNGLCGVPAAWGAHDRPFGTYPSQWSLNELNMHLYAAVQQDPDADVRKVAETWMKSRYGRKLPSELATMLLDSEDVAADAMNINGHKVARGGLSDFYYELLRYCWMYEDWQKRIEPTEDNRGRIFAEKDRNVERAQAMLRRISQLKAKLPPRAREEFTARFSDLLWTARHFAAMHKQSLTLWALKAGYVQPTVPVLESIYQWSQVMADAKAAKGRTDV